MNDTIVFFGSGPVAATSLGLLASTFKIEAVITKPKPIHHRGQFPVLETAEQLGLEVKTATSRSELSDLFTTQGFKSKIAVLVDFGIIVGQDVIDYFPLGIVNSHFSLLPEWRGADPITFSILSGQQTTGVSLMLLTAGMDEGPILAYGEYDIPSTITTPTLTSALIQLSDSLLKTVVPKYCSSEIKPLEQEQAAALSGKPYEPTYSRKLVKEDGVIDWEKPAVQIEREIRAFIEWPKSRTRLGGKEVIITAAHATPSQSGDGKPGDLHILGQEGGIGVSTREGTLWIDKIKPAGKQEMTAKAFLAGYKKLLY